MGRRYARFGPAIPALGARAIHRFIRLTCVNALSGRAGEHPGRNKGVYVMPKLVRLPALGTTDDAPVFATALAVGRLFNSHLTALRVRPDMREEIAAIAVPDFGVAAVNHPVCLARRGPAFSQSCAERPAVCGVFRPLKRPGRSRDAG